MLDMLGTRGRCVTSPPAIPAIICSRQPLPSVALRMKVGCHVLLEYKDHIEGQLGLTSLANWWLGGCPLADSCFSYSRMAMKDAAPCTMTGLFSGSVYREVH